MIKHKHKHVLRWRRSTHHRCPLHCCLHSSHTGCSEAYTGRSHTTLRLACRMLQEAQRTCAVKRTALSCLQSRLRGTDLQHLASSRPSEQSFTPSQTLLRGIQRPSPQRNWRGQAGDRQEGDLHALSGITVLSLAQMWICEVKAGSKKKKKKISANSKSLKPFCLGNSVRVLVI